MPASEYTDLIGTAHSPSQGVDDRAADSGIQEAVLQYFQLHRDPFTIAPDPSLVYPSDGHKEALAHLKYGIGRPGGFIVLTGEVGTGKTTITRLFLRDIPRDVRVAYILNTNLGAADIVYSICQELGIDLGENTPSLKQTIDLLNVDLLEAYAARKRTLVVIEEAQNLNDEVLETLRLLTNLETDTAKLLHVLLVGQPEFADRLACEDMRQLNQRVVARYHLGALSKTDFQGYVEFRLRNSGVYVELFPKNSLSMLFTVSRGIPRIANLIAQHALMGAYASGDAFVSRRLVREAASQVFGSTATTVRTTVRRRLERVSQMASELFLGNPLAKTAAYVLPVASIMIYFVLANSSPTDMALVDQEGAQSRGVAVEEMRAAPNFSSNRMNSDSLSNAYTQLLALSGIDDVAQNKEELCLIANKHGLECYEKPLLHMGQLGSTQRPTLLQHSSGQSSGQIEPVLIEEIIIQSGEALARINHPAGAESVLVAQLPGMDTAITLWQAPDGYQEVVAVGEKNPQVVQWLQQVLYQVDSDYEQVITGGVYSDAIAEKVREWQQYKGLQTDGVLGPETIMALEQELGYDIGLDGRLESTRAVE